MGWAALGFSPAQGLDLGREMHIWSEVDLRKKLKCTYAGTDRSQSGEVTETETNPVFFPGFQDFEKHTS